MKLLICAVLMTAVTACTTTCKLEDELASQVGSGLAGLGQCAHPEEIAKDVRAFIDKVDGNLCKMQTQAVLGPICAQLVDYFLGLYVVDKLPARYGCTLEVAREKVEEVVAAKCDDVL